MPCTFTVKFDKEFKPEVEKYLKKEDKDYEKSQRELQKVSKTIKKTIERALSTKGLWGVGARKTVESLSNGWKFEHKVNNKGVCKITFTDHPFIDYEDEYTARLLYKLLYSPIKRQAYNIRKMISLVRSKGFLETMRIRMTLGSYVPVWHEAIEQNKEDIIKDVSKFDPKCSVKYKVDK